MRSEKELLDVREAMENLLLCDMRVHGPVEQEWKTVRSTDEAWQKYLTENPEYAKAYREGYCSGELDALEWALGGKRKYPFEHPYA